MRSALLVAAAAAATAHTPAFTESEFKSLGRASADARVRFTAALPRRNVAQLDALLNDIAHPDSPNYGRWLTREQVQELTAPAPEHRAAVGAWLREGGASCVNGPSSLRCSARVADVERLLGTQLTSFHHVPKDRVVHKVHPDQGWAFPAHLKDKLSFITGLTEFPTVRRRNGRIAGWANGAPVAASKLRKGGKKGGRSLQTTDYIVVVETLRNLYNFKGLNATDGDMASSGGPAEFQDDSSWSAADLKAFAKQNGVADWNVTNKVGPFDPSSPDAEATLDTQYMGGVSAGNDQWYWTEADWIYEWQEAIAAAPDAKVPKVFSVSWGWSDADQCTIDPGQGPCSSGSGQAASFAYVNATNAGLAAATARGISIFVSSGDSGAHGRTDGSCATPKTHPDWPASSPYVTAVGATQLVNGVQLANPTTPYCKNPTLGACAQSGTEVVCSTATGALIVSGGGFSSVAAQPTWQAAAVKSYLASGAKNPGTGNFFPNNRGYPDVSVVGHNYAIWISGPEQVDGTSCSSPVMAGLVSVLNAQRIKAGKPVLGFLNPTIYSKFAPGGAFNDIVTGDNDCTEDTSPCPTCTGYAAAAGWDPATGFGTPKFDVLQKLVAALP